MKIVLSGGGTGGHIYPALAVAGGLRQSNPEIEILYIGTSRGLEAEIVPKEGVDFIAVSVSGMRRKLSLETITWAGRTGKSVLDALRILRKFKPSVVIGTGGYVCGPVLLAARILNIPILLHEQNAFPGKTNRWLAPMAKKVMITFQESEKYFKHPAKIVHTGLPVRQEIFHTSRKQGAKILGLSPNKRTLLVVGGSQGAHSINEAVIPIMEYIAQEQNFQLIWATGPKDYQWVLNCIKEQGIKTETLGNITIKPYIHQMAAALAVADLVVSRAGATFLTEVMAKGVASILIPFPYATDNHQEYNASSLSENGAAVKLSHSQFSPDALQKEVFNLLNNPQRLEEMAKAALALSKPDALNNILEQIKKWI